MRTHLRKLVPATVLVLAAGLVGVVLGGTGIGTAATTAKPQPRGTSLQPNSVFRL